MRDSPGDEPGLSHAQVDRIQGFLYSVVMQHFPCPVHRECVGFEAEIDMADITEATFELINEARDGHLELHRPEVTHIRRQINPRRVKGNGFYKVQLSASENGSQTLCGAEATSEDMSYGDTRHASNLAWVSCEECKRLRRSA